MAPFSIAVIRARKLARRGNGAEVARDFPAPRENIPRRAGFQRKFCKNIADLYNYNLLNLALFNYNYNDGKIQESASVSKQDSETSETQAITRDQNERRDAPEKEPC